MSSFVLGFGLVRILLDYRPALRERTGVGEFVHELARALTAPARRPPDETLVLLTTSWKDRPDAHLTSELPGVSIVDRWIPVRALAWSWNRLEWPPVETLSGPVDVAHSQTPLLIPTLRAAQIVTLHDLYFLTHPEHSVGEAQRDFPDRVYEHAHRADHVVVSSHYAAMEIQRHLGIPEDRITVCSPGSPAWAPAVARDRAAQPRRDCLLFMGTLEPRKNVPGLLEAYARLRERRPDALTLCLAGRVRDSVRPEMTRIERAPLAGHVRALGYVADEMRRSLYRRAAMLVQPSFDEGFGLPVLEAMACGVPVIVSNRGSLPEVAGNAATPIDPEDIEALAAEMERLLDPAQSAHAAAAGLTLAAQYTWEACADRAREAYRSAVELRAERSR